MGPKFRSYPIYERAGVGLGPFSYWPKEPSRESRSVVILLLGITKLVISTIKYMIHNKYWIIHSIHLHLHVFKYLCIKKSCIFKVDCPYIEWLQNIRFSVNRIKMNMDCMVKWSLKCKIFCP